MDQRARMIAAIEADAGETARQTGRAALSPRVLDAMRRVPRELFVPTGAANAAYENRPLVIGHGQTISQPFIVALMTDLLEPDPDCKVLEVGTGSGYQAAILAELVEQVWSIEVLPELSQKAAASLAEAGYLNVTLRVADGAAGWPEMAPFDRIIVTAAAPRIPAALVEQLRSPGRMVIPVGEPHGDQELHLLEKAADGTVNSRIVLPVAFVPLTKGRR
ncbi:MAG TPA: protein-L-isoaspartate(D-aspartate) O-methyltransferase [Acetobacteraceae bacterium]